MELGKKHYYFQVNQIIFLLTAGICCIEKLILILIQEPAHSGACSILKREQTQRVRYLWVYLRQQEVSIKHQWRGPQEMGKCQRTFTHTDILHRVGLLPRKVRITISLFQLQFMAPYSHVIFSYQILEALRLI